MNLRLILLLAWTTIFVCCGCSMATKAEALIAKVDSKVDAVAKTVESGIATGRAYADEKVAKATAELAAKGAPVDGTVDQMTAWVKDNPGGAASSMMALAIWYVSTKLKRIRAALSATTKTVEAQSPEIQAAIKTGVMQQLVTKSPEARVIRDAKV